MSKDKQAIEYAKFNLSRFLENNYYTIEVMKVSRYRRRFFLIEEYRDADDKNAIRHRIAEVTSLVATILDMRIYVDGSTGYHSFNNVGKDIVERLSIEMYDDYKKINCKEIQ